jgi:hypothetical protein
VPALEAFADDLGVEGEVGRAGPATKRVGAGAGEAGVVGEVGEVEREGTAEVLPVLLSVGDGGSGLPVVWSAGSEVRRRLKGMRREGRR